MPGSHADTRLLDLDPVVCRKGLGHLLRDLEIGAQVVGGGALRELDQPARVLNKQRLISWCDGAELVENALNLREPVAGAIRSAVPQAQTQQLEASYDIHV